MVDFNQYVNEHLLQRITIGKEMIKMYIEGLPSKLKKARDETGFTQREVAKETDIPQPTIARYEKGTRLPDPEKLGILADFYGVSVDWLLGTKGGKKE